MSVDVTTEALDAFIDERQAELIDFVCELVATPSPSPPGDERAAAGLVAERLRALGVAQVEVASLVTERPNVLGRVPGRGQGPTFMLCGHLDTKPPGDLGAWKRSPWDPVVDDGVLTGLGSADMKGAVGAMVYAAAAVAEVGTDGTLALVFTADEEAGGRFGARWLADEGLLQADACVIGEPSGISDDWDAIRLVSRGSALFTIRVRGTQMHSSLSDQFESVNASVQMARLMSAMDSEGFSLLTYSPHPLVAHPTLNVGLTAESGIGYGILSGGAEFLSDVRALPGMTKEGIEADLLAFLEEARAADPTLEARLEIDHWTPPCEIPPGHPVVEALAGAAAVVLGKRPPLAGFPGGTDAPYFQLVAGIPTVPSFGPGLLTVAHTPNESIRVESIVQAARIYAHASARFLGG